jgi:hypothetical protein
VIDGRHAVDGPSRPACLREAAPKTIPVDKLPSVSVVKAAGVSWWAYQSFMKKHERQIEEETLLKVPASLDLTPYRDEKDSRCWSD